MGKPHRALFHEFKGGSATPDEIEGSGDVKYHLGASSDREFDNNKVHLSLTANPVASGNRRSGDARQSAREAGPARRNAGRTPHGDAAADCTATPRLPGRGGGGMFRPVHLKGYRVGGSIHLIVKQPDRLHDLSALFALVALYPSDVAKMVEALIFHVNGDDPEAVVYAAKVATEYRQKFQRPVVIDMFCYRRFGHNEGYEPSFTQPLMYQKIRAHRPRRKSTPRS